MLGLFIGRCICDYIDTKHEPNDPNSAAFDIGYVNEANYKFYSLTKTSGYYVAFRAYNESNQPGEYQFMTFKNKSISVPNKYTVTFHQDFDRVNTYQKVWFEVENNDFNALTFDLGVFADIYVQTDQDSVSATFNNRAFTIDLYRPLKPVTHILKHTYWEDVDTMFMGNVPNSEKMDKSTYPYWEKKIDKYTRQKDDTAIAFSWQNKTVPAIGTKSYGFVIIIGKKYDIQPFVREVTPKRVQYPKNFNMSFEVTEYDKQKVTLYFTWDNKEKRYEFNSDGNENVHKIFTIPVEFGDKKKIKYSYYAVDSQGIKSTTNPVIDTKYVEGSDPPQIDVTKPPSGPYYPGDQYMYVEGEVEDEKEVTIYYKIDQGQTMSSSSIPTYDPGWQHFELNVVFPAGFTFGPHTFEVWVEDEFHTQSDHKSYTFLYKVEDRPSITSVYISDEKVPVNETTNVVIYGEGTDPNASQIISLFATFEGESRVYVGNFTSAGHAIPFAFFYPVDGNRKPGRYSITLDLVDSEGQTSKETRTLYIRIVDPNAPVPPMDFGKIIDVTKETLRDKPNSNALFNLQYEDTYQRRSEMSYKNEGFFVAFRPHKSLFGGADFSATTLLRYKDGGEDMTFNVGNFTIQFYTQDQDLTGYKQLVFSVTNNGYFDNRFDLSVFVDSDLAGDDNSTIKIRDDGRGFSVSNDAQNIHYTIFTRNYDPFPSISSEFLIAGKREGEGEIPFNNMPFFNKTREGLKELKGVDAMYGFSWTYKRVPADQTLELGVTLAAHDLIKTPPRIKDKTQYKKWYDPGDIINFTIDIYESDAGENVSVFYWLGAEPTIEWYIANGSTLRVERQITVPDRPFSLLVAAKNEEYGAAFISNVISVQIPVTKPPRVSFHENLIKQKYIEGQKIMIAGEFYDETQITIFYKFTNGRIHKLGTFKSSETHFFNTEVEIPPQVQPNEDYEWSITAWAEDDQGVKSEQVLEKSFWYSPNNPPVLTKAGLSKKVASIGQKVLCYAAVSDKQGRNIDVYMKIGQDGVYKREGRYDNSQTVGTLTPFAFYWTVPDVAPGSYDIYFKALDYDELESKEIIRTILITN